jgi:hypothetical protein
MNAHSGETVWMPDGIRDVPVLGEYLLARKGKPMSEPEQPVPQEPPSLPAEITVTATAEVTRAEEVTGGERPGSDDAGE